MTIPATDCPNLPYRQQLLDAALAVRKQAYAPYSHFLVGAAVLVPGGQIFGGCNVENASYGLTICAERNAVWQAIAAGHREIAAVAVAAAGGAAPCGACRQVLAEFADDLCVYLIDSDHPETVRETRLSELLPWRFDRRQLGTETR